MLVYQRVYEPCRLKRKIVSQTETRCPPLPLSRWVFQVVLEDQSSSRCMVPLKFTQWYLVTWWCLGVKPRFNMIQLVLVPSDESCLMCGFVAGKRGTHILNGLQSRPRIPRSCPHVEVQPWNPRAGYTPTFHMFFNIPTLHMVSSCCWWTLQLFCFFFAFFLDKSHTSLVPIVATYSNLLMEPSFLAKIRSGFDCTLHTSLRSDCARKFRMEPKNWDVAKKYWFYMGSMQSSEGVISLLFRLPTPSFSQVQVPATSGLGFPVVLPVFT